MMTERTKNRLLLLLAVVLWLVASEMSYQDEMMIQEARNERDKDR